MGVLHHHQFEKFYDLLWLIFEIVIYKFEKFKW